MNIHVHCMLLYWHGCIFAVSLDTGSEHIAATAGEDFIPLDRYVNIQAL